MSDESATIDIDGLDQDALNEVINIAVGASASALSDMVGSSVNLSVPNVNVLTNAEAVSSLISRVGSEMALVRQSFDGNIAGDSMLVFPEENSLRIVQLVLQEDMPLETLAELEGEVLSELGNVLLNGFVGTLANTLGSPASTGLPEFDRTTTNSENNIFRLEEGQNALLFIHVDFNLHTEDIRGYLALVVNVQSLNTLIESVRRYIGL